ncbi:MAG: histidinol-phosphate transaminase [Chthoniobacterales bacterium]|nr:histidinol-phosphate transaminase [Chthoniobacterales bacterium]
MNSVWELANPHLRDLAVYEPGKPIEETARELGSDAGSIIKLASNENPLGASPAALAAMRAALDQAHLYPDGGGYYLREALAAKLGVERANIILGSGSNEIIEFLGHAFLLAGDDVVTSEHAFIAYKLVAAGFGARTIEVPSPDLRHHLDAMSAAITPRTRLVFIANPNNPTGTLLEQTQIDSFMRALPERITVVFDEAYFEYVDGPPDVLKYVHAGRHVIVLRTFSKMHGLANLRIGYGIAPPELIQVLQKTRQPFNVSGIAQAAALAALGDKSHQEKTKRITDQGRTFLQHGFSEMDLPFVPSAGNFVLVRVGDSAAVFRALLARKIIVRALKGYHLPEWVRISVGTMEQNRRCLSALREVIDRAAT